MSNVNFTPKQLRSLLSEAQGYAHFGADTAGAIALKKAEITPSEWGGYSFLGLNPEQAIALRQAGITPSEFARERTRSMPTIAQVGIAAMSEVRSAISLITDHIRGRGA